AAARLPCRSRHSSIPTCRATATSLGQGAGGSASTSSTECVTLRSSASAPAGRRICGHGYVMNRLPAGSLRLTACRDPSRFVWPGSGYMRSLRLRSPSLLAALALVAGVSAVAVATSAAASSTEATVPRYDHIALIVEENHGFADVIGNPNAPNLN